MSENDPPSDSSATDSSAMDSDHRADWQVDTFRNYEVRSLIGQGGSASVVEAFDINMRRPLALKQILKDLASDKDQVERFVSEARIMADLAHPGIVPVHELGLSENGNCFYTMKKVSGMTLREMLDTRKGRDLYSKEMLAALLEVFERICQTTAYAHSKGVIHRDIKPENIMVDNFDAVYLMDWGIAKKIEENAVISPQLMTQAGSIIGTPAYLSPEQASGRSHEADRRSDVFLLGIVLYEILTGRRPFWENTVDKLLDAVISHNPETPSKLNPQVDKFMSAICMKALEKDPADRYKDAGELAEDIQRHRRFLPVSVLKPGLRDAFVSWIRRKPTLAASIGIAMFALAVLMGVAAYRSYTHNEVLEQAYGRLDYLREQIIAYEQDIGEVGEELDGSLTSAKRIDLELEQEELESNLKVARVEVTALLRALLGLTFFKPDSRVLEEVRDEVFDSIDDAFEDRRYIYARVLIESALEKAKGRNYIRLSEENIKRLERLKERAQKRIEQLKKERLKKRNFEF